MLKLINRFIMPMVAILTMPLSALFYSLGHADMANNNENYLIGNVPLDIFQTMNKEGCQPIQDYHSPEYRTGSPFVRFGNDEYIALCQFKIKENIFKYKIVVSVNSDHVFASCPRNINLVRLEDAYRINWDIDFTYKPSGIGLAMIYVPDPEYHLFEKLGERDVHLKDKINEKLTAIEIDGRCNYCYLTALLCVSGSWYENSTIYAD